MTELIGTILENPLYILLFGSGGVLVIIVAIVSVIIQKKKSNFDSTINVRKSKKTEIKNNSLKNQSIQVEKSEDTTISRNK
ncbi:hypothetical protein [Hungatella hathewayi]|uniref:hypothetical protein n=1 Tax=Hungatella hathewayi TaxID=154046 RepID=UPI0035614F94